MQLSHNVTHGSIVACTILFCDLIFVVIIFFVSHIVIFYKNAYLLLTFYLLTYFRFNGRFSDEHVSAGSPESPGFSLSTLSGRDSLGIGVTFLANVNVLLYAVIHLSVVCNAHAQYSAG